MTQRVLDFEKLIENPNAQVYVATNRWGVRGIYTNDIQIRAGNNWDSRVQTGAASTVNTIQKAGQDFQGIINQQTSLDLDVVPRGVSFGNLQQSSKQWVGAETPVFNIDMVFIALRGGDDVVTKVHQLYETCFPGGQTSIATISPPLDYTVGDKGGSASGTITVQLGRWFRATQQIMQSVNFTFSKETTPDGGPLYARGSIEFTPFKAITYGDFSDYFTTLSRTSTQSNPATKEVTSVQSSDEDSFLGGIFG